MIYPIRALPAGKKPRAFKALDAPAVAAKHDALDRADAELTAARPRREPLDLGECPE